MKPRNFPRQQEKRRQAAQIRQAAYDALTDEEKLARARPDSNEFNKLTKEDA